jgi:RNA polymerase sigma-70 factor, ECF subfamily
MLKITRFPLKKLALGYRALMSAGPVQFASSTSKIHTLRGALEDTGEDGEFFMTMADPSLDPEQSASRAELGQLLEEAVLGLPWQFRTVVMLRDVEELSTSETAAALDLSEENVKVRLHRGRAMLRAWLSARVGAEARNAFPFMGVRCDRVVHSVLLRLAELRRDEPQIH